MDKTALLITLLVAVIALFLVFLRLFFGGQISHWFN
jgi:hypothetical protein